MKDDLIYVYCTTNSSPELTHAKELKGLKILRIHDFYVIVKYVSESEFSEENFKKNLSDIQWVELNVRDQIMVISMIMESGTVIPFKFGTIYNSEARLRKYFTDNSDSLLENFDNLAGKEEWLVKIFCDRKVLCEQIDELSEGAAALEKQIMASSPGKAFLLKRKKTELIENEMDRLCEKYGQEYYDEFKILSEATYLNNLLPKDLEGREDSMILNASFLIRKNKLTEFKNTVDVLKKQDGNSCFFIESTGPWPLFSFTSIKKNSNAR
jgi:hypothetical protein